MLSANLSHLISLLDKLPTSVIATGLIFPLNE
jgi:hypothetical protein